MNYIPSLSKADVASSQIPTCCGLLPARVVHQEIPVVQAMPLVAALPTPVLLVRAPAVLLGIDFY